MKINIHFIINPIAGKGKNELSPDLIESYFPKSEYSVSIKKTLFVFHATALTMASIEEGAEIIVACGGDGTINEVASCLVNTSIKLGILPMGSGNGLASNLKIPKLKNKALEIVQKQKVVAIDTGAINRNPFFSNTGVGFDAHVISDYEENTTRQLFSYLKSTLRTLRKYSYNEIIELDYDGGKELISPFLLFVSNSNEMGYKMSLTPRASLQDGLLDLIIVPRLSPLKLFKFTLLFLFKKHHWMKQVRYLQVERLKIKSVSNKILKAQKDGEIFFPEDTDITIEIYPRSLSVCMP